MPMGTTLDQASFAKNANSFSRLREFNGHKHLHFRPSLDRTLLLSLTVTQEAFFTAKGTSEISDRFFCPQTLLHAFGEEKKEWNLSKAKKCLSTEKFVASNTKIKTLLVLRKI